MTLAKKKVYSVRLPPERSEFDSLNHIKITLQNSLCMSCTHNKVDSGQNVARLSASLSVCIQLRVERKLYKLLFGYRLSAKSGLFVFQVELY